MICISLTDQNLENLLENLKENEKKADIIEVRLDFQEDLNFANLKSVIDHLIRIKTKPMIITVRSKKEGGNFPNQIEKQIEILLYAIEKNAEYVDIELGWPSKTYKYISRKKKQTKLIASYHNFKKTPTIYGLKKIARRLAWTKADILKIASKVNNYTDNQNLFLIIDFIRNRYKMPSICLGMGIKGLISRIMQTEMGGYFTFLCPENIAGNEIGQPTFPEYIELRNKLKLN